MISVQNPSEQSQKECCGIERYAIYTGPRPSQTLRVQCQHERVRQNGKWNFFPYEYIEHREPDEEWMYGHDENCIKQLWMNSGRDHRI